MNRPCGGTLGSSDSGETWSKETPPSGTKDLYGVAIAGADVYVTGAEGTLLRRRGGAYEALASGTREALTTVVARGAEVVAAGTYGNLLRAGGAGVTPVTQGSSVAVTGLARLPSGVVVLSGTDGAVRRVTRSDFREGQPSFDPALHGHRSRQAGPDPLITAFVRS